MTTIISILGFGAETKPSVNSGFGSSERKPVEKVEPVKREEPKKPAAEPLKKPVQEHFQKPEPVKSFEQSKTEAVKKPEQSKGEAERKPAEPVKRSEATKTESTKKFDTIGAEKKQEEKITNELKKPAEKKAEQVKPSTEVSKPVETKAPKTKAAPTKKRPLETSEIRHSTRERKPVHIENIAPTTSHQTVISVPSGHGTKLADISHIQHELGKRKSSDAAVQQLHRLVYGRVGEAGKRKELLRKFNGFADEKSVMSNSHYL